jgi:spore photoproduct lyase
MYDLAPPAVFAHESVVGRQPDRGRMEAVVRATGLDPADVVVFDDEGLPELLTEHGLVGRRRTMGTLAEVHDPVLLFNTFRFDGRRREREEWLAERTPVDNKILRLALLGYGAWDWFPAGLKEDPWRHDKVCRACWRLHFQNGCPHRCLYCGFGGLLVTMTNIEDYIEQLDKVIAAHPWQLTYLFEDDADVPCLEPELGCLGPLVEHFGTLDSRYLIIHTKSANFDWMLDLDHRGNTVVVWSLSARTQSEQIEPRTGTWRERVEAARKMQEAGYTIRYKLKPIVPVANWREEASELIELALTETRPDVISLFSFAWMDVDRMKACLDPDLLDADYLRAAEEAVEEMKDCRAKPFPERVRAEIYQHHIDEIRKWHRDVPISLSTETWTMWRRFQDQLGAQPHNYVCGCGPQSTPWRTKLDCNAWAVAKRVPVDTGDDGAGWYGSQDK